MNVPGGLGTAVTFGAMGAVFAGLGTAMFPMAMEDNSTGFVLLGMGCIAVGMAAMPAVAGMSMTNNAHFRPAVVGSVIASLGVAVAGGFIGAQLVSDD